MPYNKELTLAAYGPLKIFIIKRYMNLIIHLGG